MKISFLFFLLLSPFLNAFAQLSDRALTQKRFSKQELMEDIDYLTTVINRVHPNMYHSIDPQRYQFITDSVKHLINDSITGREAWPLLARLVGALGEGHSVFDYPAGVIDQLKSDGSRLFPVAISAFNGKGLIVRLDRSEENLLSPGDQITAINGISVSKLIDILSGYTGGLKTFRSIDVCRNIIIYLYLYQIEGPYTINYLHEGKAGTAVLSALPWPEIRENSAARTKGSQPNHGTANHVFNYLDQHYAYVAINSLTENPETFKRYLDSVFSVLKTKQTQKLIIDLRRNGGGNSVLGEILINYITCKPFRMSAGERWKVSGEYKEQIHRNLQGEELQKMDFYLNAAEGSTLSDNGEKPKRPAYNPLFYNGKVYVLIGPNTFSSANMMANAIQDYHLATLVGEPTGEPANDYGELIFLKLPHSGFTFSTSTKQFVRANGDTKDRQPVLPKYYIPDNHSTPQDEALELVKSL